MPMRITPFGGELVDLRVPAGEVHALRARAALLPSLQLGARTLCDLELLANGAFSPQDRFLGREDYRAVLESMRRSDGVLCPIPVCLPAEPFLGLGLDAEVALRDERNEILAVMRVEEIYEWERETECLAVLGTSDPRHPLVAECHRWGRYYLSGPLCVIGLPAHHDFQDLRLTPRQVRDRLDALGARQVVAFQTRNPIHRVHEELMRRATDQEGTALLVHPTVGLTRPDDVDHYTRVRTYRALVARRFDPRRTLLALLPLAMRMAGPREALWHAIIRRNFGADRFIVGRDHAGPGVDSRGRPFYGPYAAQDLVERHAAEIGVRPVPFQALVYLPDADRYEEVERVAAGTPTLELSGTEVRENFLNAGRRLPEWFTRPEVSEILHEAFPPLYRRGCCLWFTGLSGSGKSTTADVVVGLLLQHGRQVTVLDGDVVRTHLSRGLGFSREDRDINVRRVAYVASEVVRHGGAVICALVSPYRIPRSECRSLIGPGFIEIYMDAPLEICEQRDLKGLYERARRGQVRGVAGIDDPYEPPLDPELVLDTVRCSAEENGRRILEYLRHRGYVPPSPGALSV
ncbi:MAG: bifunctional sulfate adenylyltransferase/adenylylsulfate kinase [Planctomycetes bacterium]|nr:bifunctional sulfate adenylyltransferase/adenylylsulfate kinase [Planctomycetota bacterium]